MSSNDTLTFINGLTSFYGSRANEVQDALVASRVHIVRYTTLERQQKRYGRQERIRGHVVRPRSGHGELHELTHNPAPVDYALALEMHELWCAYCQKIMCLDQKAFATVDLHGARIRVLRSSMPSYVGVEGICVRDTAATMELVTEANKHVFVPKASVDVGLFLPNGSTGMVYLVGKLLRRKGNKKVKRFDTELDGRIT
ncbi:putative Ribonuclease P protein subunit [Giardia duodenalis]|uniref:Ribonuclease P protein subunit p29 n=2 Tax=Giardia intestinalis TaxID=5741 RepID=A8BGJ9_GIAIC|nr:putative Ribonuclease P protein subunit [Giardia intestinalis]ESU38850.1 Hypothetical protein DHA2_2400 [Giardia intestinalis]KAE8302163.1 putative Ribonuclease P protein subunit [Giardia intestinalis]|eukprot:XP_001707200.1 Ribonuclease P protein subunit, putative [Giardia lamblia ATCC 50803]